VAGERLAHPRAGDSAAAERQHTVVLDQRRTDHTLLDATEFLLPVGGEDVGDGSAGLLLDGHVAVEQAHPECLGQPPPDGGFARARQSDEYRFGCLRWRQRHPYPDFRAAGASRSATARR
jgi:hypothetical protein